MNMLVDDRMNVPLASKAAEKMNNDERADVKPSRFTRKPAHIIGTVASVTSLCGLKNESWKVLLGPPEVSSPCMGTVSILRPYKLRNGMRCASGLFAGGSVAAAVWSTG